MGFGKIVESILHKGFSDQEIKKFIGEHVNSYLAYAGSEGTRKNAASGGVVSAILIDLLNNNLIDGALVCKTCIIDGRVRSRFTIAKTATEILDTQGSTYVSTNFPGEALKLIREFPGKLGVVGLPCDITMLYNKAQKDPFLKEKTFLTIALACGHNSQKQLIDNITTNLEKEANSELISYRFRRGHWRGELSAGFKDNKRITKSFSYFSLYQNLFFFCEKKCLHCYDHFGYNADLSIGDIWSYELKKKSVKSNFIIAKTMNGSSILENILSRSTLMIRPIKISEIVEGQKRSAPFHYNLSARHKAGIKLGISIADHVSEKVKWHEFIAAYIVLFNWKLSQHQHMRNWIFKIPRLFLKVYLYLLKGLESIK